MHLLSYIFKLFVDTVEDAYSDKGWIRMGGNTPDPKDAASELETNLSYYLTYALYKQQR
jgi:hypothetical protein